MNNFSKAVSNVLKRYAERGVDTIDVKEIWIDTSLPEDFLIEMIRKGEVEIPEEIVEIKRGSHAVWRRKKP